MLYMVPGALAGGLVYAILLGLSWVINVISARRYRLGAHSRFIVYCLIAVGFMIFLVVAGGGGNWATHMQASGYILAGCILSAIDSKIVPGDEKAES